MHMQAAKQCQAVKGIELASGSAKSLQLMDVPASEHSRHAQTGGSDQIRAEYTAQVHDSQQLVTSPAESSLKPMPAVKFPIDSDDVTPAEATSFTNTSEATASTAPSAATSTTVGATATPVVGAVAESTSSVHMLLADQSHASSAAFSQVVDDIATAGAVTAA